MEECLRAPVRRLSEATAGWWRLSGWGRGGSCSLFPLTTQIALTKGLQIALEGVGCTCSEEPTYEHPDHKTDLASVKACRDVIRRDWCWCAEG